MHVLKTPCVGASKSLGESHKAGTASLVSNINKRVINVRPATLCGSCGYKIYSPRMSLIRIPVHCLMAFVWCSWVKFKLSIKSGGRYHIYTR